MSMKGSFASLACFFSASSIFSPLPPHLHLFMHQGEIEIYQGARPCLCRLHGAKILKEEFLFEATGARK